MILLPAVQLQDDYNVITLYNVPKGIMSLAGLRSDQPTTSQW